DVQIRREIDVDAKAAQLAALLLALLAGKHRVPGLADRLAGGEDCHAIAEHDDTPALMIRTHEKFPFQAVFQVRDEFAELIGGFEVDPVKNQTAAVRVLEVTDDLIGDPRARDAKDEPLSDEFFESH